MDNSKHSFEETVNLDNPEVLYVVTLICSMLHMAHADGEYALSEKKYISRYINIFQKFENEINHTVNYFKKNPIKEEFIVELFHKSKKKFSQDQLKTLIEHSAKVLLVDGMIHENEKILLKSYIFAAGLDSDIIEELLININQ